MIIKQNTINALASIVFIVISLILAGSIYFLNQAVVQQSATTDTAIELKQLSLELAAASISNGKRACSPSQRGSTSGSAGPKSKGTRRVIEVLTLQKTQYASAKMDLLAEAKNNSDALVATETRVPCA
ncbi:MAG: hypothetical protein R2856_32850 [Caldilineaceae bacterium]